MPEETSENLIRNLPDGDSATRFLAELAERYPGERQRLSRNAGLLADVLTIVSFSPLLATTLLQHKSYFAWLDRQRRAASVRSKEDLLESLARFEMTHSTLEPNVILSRFRRRELLRIYLQDVRDLETIAEITEEISNLADAILEHALRLARQELDNRYGPPLETDDKGRATEARFCIVALGKLGSLELNYASDIDLLFLYSSEGNTSGTGSRGTVTNREYFVKLAEQIIKLVGQQTGEGAAYRVDMRLRPHGRVGALAIPVNEAVSYYLETARPWERQVLIRSRGCAGDVDLFKRFAQKVERRVFSNGGTVADALRNVRQSKDKINFEKRSAEGLNVKIGIGGIREIEFISQALQLAYGGKDEWLREPHTLISLTRLADRGLISETEHTDLASAYTFLRRVEHRIQMEHGLQTHLVPNDPDRRTLIAKRMYFERLADFDAALNLHTGAVSKAFRRIFGVDEESEPETPADVLPSDADVRIPIGTPVEPALGAAISSLEKSGFDADATALAKLGELATASPHFAGFVAANPSLIEILPHASEAFAVHDYAAVFMRDVAAERTFAGRIAQMRQRHSRFMFEIAVAEIFGKISMGDAKTHQTTLAEASVNSAVAIVKDELALRIGRPIDRFPFAVLGLGKLGGNAMDYGSDLDLVLVYDDESPLAYADPESLTPAVVFGKAVELFVTTLSAMTREGSLYRVDLRLRPDGKNGAPANGISSFLNYFETRAAVWEWLAYVKLRGVGGDLGLAERAADRARGIIHRRALTADPDEIRSEALRVREMLELQKAGRKRRSIDIKYGEGGLLDVYFAMRYLQLRDDVPDDDTDRSTVSMLNTLYNRGSLSAGEHQSLAAGYSFLSELDHYLRLTIGRATKLPPGREVLARIASMMKMPSVNDLHERLAFHRMEIRASFESVLKH